jgi:hypothetical protein
MTLMTSPVSAVTRLPLVLVVSATSKARMSELIAEPRPILESSPSRQTDSVLSFRRHDYSNNDEDRYLARAISRHDQRNTDLMEWAYRHGADWSIFGEGAGRQRQAAYNRRAEVL